MITSTLFFVNFVFFVVRKANSCTLEIMTRDLQDEFT